MLVALFTLVLAQAILGEVPHVTTSQGRLVGQVLKSRGARDYFAFTRVPFAKPPIGPLRFMAPEPADAWKGILDATQPTPTCYQKDPWRQSTDGQEDCLYLNVFSPNITGRSLPVIFSIYGGGFGSGNAGTASSNQFFMDEDVVLVRPNYRIGSLGFLSFEDDMVPGNMGLKDQALALEWTKREISSFGGNPDLITVIGESAGGASSNIICSAPRTTGLIKSCVSQSGVGWSPWAFQEPGISKMKALTLSRDVGCLGDQILQCLQSKPVEEIASLMQLEDSFYPEAGPVLEPPSAPGALIIKWPPGPPLRYRWITGVTHDEGMLLTAAYEYHTKTEEETNAFIKKFDGVVVKELHLENRTCELKRIKDRFFTNGIEPLIAIRNYFTEFFFVYPTLKGLTYHTGPKYFYQFNYAGLFLSLRNNALNVTGIPHSAEMPFFFKQKGNFSDEDTLLSKQLIKMWVNFASGQSPAEGEQFNWLEFEDGKYLDIENYGISCGNYTRYHEILNFWKDFQ